MTVADIPQVELGRTEAFLSYDSLSEVNGIDPQRQFKYAEKGFYILSVTWHNRGLIGVSKHLLNLYVMN